MAEGGNFQLWEWVGLGLGGLRVACARRGQGFRIRFKLINITPAFISPDAGSLFSPPRLGPLPQSGVTEGHPVQSSGGAGQGPSCTRVAVPLLPLHNPVFFTSSKVLILTDLTNFLSINFHHKTCFPEPDLRHLYIHKIGHHFQALLQVITVVFASSRGSDK